MCFSFDASPPDLPADLARVAGGAAAEILELTSEDGARFSAALSMSAEPEPQGAAVVVLPDVRGLYRFYVELTERFAAAGHHAIAIDYFGRTAGVGERGEQFEYMPHVMQTKVAQVQADAAAAIAALRERAGRGTPVVTVGFCFGGSQSFLAATNESLGLDGAVGFYAGIDLTRYGLPSLIDQAADVRCPVLGLYGGADANITPEQVEAFDDALAAAGVPHEIVVYPGAPHSFFDRRYEEHREACEDAWRRVLGFLDSVPAGAAA
jgi:carboxymethylenebutenolidase